MSLSSMMSKKIGPVPVVYIGLGGAAIFLVFALKMKPSTSTPEPTAEETAGESPYDSLATTGTVIAPTAVIPSRPTTNDEWIREGAEWLSVNKKIGPTAAYAALSKFVNGQSRSTQEAQWIDWVISEKGYPPDPFEDSPLPVGDSTGSNTGGAQTKPGFRKPTGPVTIPDTTTSHRVPGAWLAR